MNIKKLIAFLAVMLFSNLAFAQFHSGIEVKIKAVKYNVTSNENVFVKVSYKNKTDMPIQLLQWYLPNAQNELEDGIFKISREGVIVPYLGRHYKRPAPIGEDYLTLGPHQKIDFKVELSGIYDFSEQGYYSIDLKVQNLALFSQDTSRRGNSPFNSLKADAITEVFVRKVEQTKGKRCNPRKQDCGDDGGNGGTGDVTFTGACSNSEQTTLMSALDAAKTMANDSVNYLNGNSGNRYTTWFGAYSNSRWNKVSNNFDAIKDALDNKPKTLDCSCNQRYFAYVYPAQPYKIYLCRAFWSASLTGTDSKGGTLIHEMSHFNVVAGTDDVVYGQSGAMNLANSDPNAAITNADSHEYFAENNPDLN